jgi:hypothetical protein
VELSVLGAALLLEPVDLLSASDAVLEGLLLHAASNVANPTARVSFVKRSRINVSMGDVYQKAAPHAKSLWQPR